jgi:threonine/homoserine/homoserine lactone efflux protein
VAAAIGQLLPLGVGVAISPIPITVVILMLMSRRADANGLSFALGWVGGVTLVTAVALVVTCESSDSRASSQSTGTAVAQLIVGIAFVALAIRQWHKRGSDGAQPKWMTALERVGPARAVGLGLLMGAANPKNLLLSVSAGLAIGTRALPVGLQVVAVAVFVVVASTTIAGPVAYYLVSSARARVTLQSWRSWLATNNAAVLAALLLVIGVSQLGNAITGLS